MTPRQYVEAILNGSQSYSLTFERVVIFKGDTQLVLLDEKNTEENCAIITIYKDYRYWGDPIKFSICCLTDIQKFGLLLNYDDSDDITINSNRWLKVAEYPQIVIMNYVENGNIDSISLIADDEEMLTFQIRSGEYDILAIQPIFHRLMAK